MKTLFLKDNGKGQPALVFLHYFGGSSRTWRFVVDILSKSFRCISVDLPGFGDSADFNTADYTVASSALAIPDSLSSLNVGDFVLIGHSMGAKIALQFATSRPVGLRSIVLAAGSPPVPEPMKDADRQDLIEMYGKPDLIRAHLRKIVHRPVPEDILDELAEDNLRSNVDAWKSWAETGSKEDISDLMKNISVPVHFIAGEFDDPLSPAYIKEISEKYFPGSEVRTIANAAHLLPIDAPKEIAALINAIATS